MLVPGRLTSVTCKMGFAPIRELCIDFTSPLSNNEETGPGYMNQRPASKKKKLEAMKRSRPCGGVVEWMAFGLDADG